MNINTCDHKLVTMTTEDAYQCAHCGLKLTGEFINMLRGGIIAKVSRYVREWGITVYSESGDPISVELNDLADDIEKGKWK